MEPHAGVELELEGGVKFHSIRPQCNPALKILPNRARAPRTTTRRPCT